MTGGDSPRQPVPRAVIDAVAGRPTVGEWDVMVPILTVDRDGYPHVCLLSRAELDADDERVYAVLASSTTIGVRRSRRATLLTVGADAATYTKLDVASTHEDNGRLLVIFTVAAVRRDGIGIPLRPPAYLVTETLAAQENWARSTALLTRGRCLGGR